MSVRHVFSVEIEHYKREFIKSAHTPSGETPSFCLFEDVAGFEQDSAWCHTCGKHHSTALDVDVYFVGPSCKNISYENPKAAQYAQCYTDHDGCSGQTYRLGVLKGIEKNISSSRVLREHKRCCRSQERYKRCSAPSKNRGYIVVETYVLQSF